MFTLIPLLFGFFAVAPFVGLENSHPTTSPLSGRALPHLSESLGSASLSGVEPGRVCSSSGEEQDRTQGSEPQLPEGVQLRASIATGLGGSRKILIVVEVTDRVRSITYLRKSDKIRITYYDTTRRIVGTPSVCFYAYEEAFWKGRSETSVGFVYAERPPPEAAFVRVELLGFPTALVPIPHHP
jgi:hypothetical protein